MKAMVLAAGRGERMRPLTDTTPKPLLMAGGQRLIDYHLRKLAAAGFTDVVINLSYLGEQIRDALADGQRYGLHIQYSEEGPEPLETAGGIIHALPLLGEQPFLLVNADVWTDFDFSGLQLANNKLANLVLVDNPKHHPKGDFGCLHGELNNQNGEKLTYAGIGVYSPQMFADLAPGRRALAPVLRAAVQHGQVDGVHFRGAWFDIGTMERLSDLEKKLVAAE